MGFTINVEVCHICQAEAVSRCYTCGQLVCAEHGKGQTCARCTSAIAAGDPRGDRISETPMPAKDKDAWWRPQQADEYVPPACYSCQGLARGLCRNCDARYCAEHAGPNGLCLACGKSANLGLYVLLIMGGLLALLILGNWFYGYAIRLFP